MFTVLTVILGLIWRVASRQGQTNEKLNNLAADVHDVTVNLDRHIQWHLRSRRQ